MPVLKELSLTHDFAFYSTITLFVQTVQGFEKPPLPTVTHCEGPVIAAHT